MSGAGGSPVFGDPGGSVVSSLGALQGGTEILVHSLCRQTHLGKLQGDSGAQESLAVQFVDGVIRIPGVVKLGKSVLALLDQHVPHSAVFLQELLDVAHFAVWREIAQEDPGVSSPGHCCLLTRDCLKRKCDQVRGLTFLLFVIKVMTSHISVKGCYVLYTDNYTFETMFVLLNRGHIHRTLMSSRTN